MKKAKRQKHRQRYVKRKDRKRRKEKMEEEKQQDQFSSHRCKRQLSSSSLTGKVFDSAFLRQQNLFERFTQINVHVIQHASLHYHFRTPGGNISLFSCYNDPLCSPACLCLVCCVLLNSGFISLYDESNHSKCDLEPKI